MTSEFSEFKVGARAIVLKESTSPFRSVQALEPFDVGEVVTLKERLSISDNCWRVTGRGIEGLYFKSELELLPDEIHYVPSQEGDLENDI